MRHRQRSRRQQYRTYRSTGVYRPRRTQHTNEYLISSVILIALVAGIVYLAFPGLSIALNAMLHSLLSHSTSVASNAHTGNNVSSGSSTGTAQHVTTPSSIPIALIISIVVIIALIAALVLGAGRVAMRRLRGYQQESVSQKEAWEQQQREQQQRERLTAEQREQEQWARTQTIEALRALTPRDFELWTVQLLHRLGYSDVQHTGRSDDRGADLTATGPDGAYVVVQCKKFAEGNKVDSPTLQSFVGMAVWHHKAERGIFVTTSTFTKQARDAAQNMPVQLIDGNDLTRFVQGWR